MKKFVICISRQFGSGGHEIGRKLAEKTGVPFYDKELLTRIARDSGISEKLVSYYDEMPSKSLLFSLAMDAYPMSFTEIPVNQKVYQAQVETIKNIAETESCVIIGRCADAILSDMDNIVSVFIHADMDANSFYNYYAEDKKWGEASSHDLTLDSGKIGIDNSVTLLYDYLKIRGIID